VTYVVDRIDNSVADVGFGTRIRRGGKFRTHYFGRRARRVGHQSASRPKSRLATDDE
jgi:hypothetical protein